MLHHYVYLLEFPNGMKYVGVHSTKNEPEMDVCYLGSGKALPLRDRFSCKKTILKTFPNREEAVEYEINFIIENNCVDSGDWYNLRTKTHDKHGSVLSEEHKRTIQETATGRSRNDYGKKYTGAGRTPAQRAGDRAAGNKIRGTKNPAKGSPGIANQGFVPWYYVTPEGEYVEVHDVPKQDYAERLGFTARQLGHRFHHTNMHKPGRVKMFKNWTFGNLPRPTEMNEV